MNTMGKLTDKYTAEQRAAMAERARLLKLFGEKHGPNRLAEDLKKLRKAETAPPTPQEPTRRKRKRGGGNKPKLEEQTIKVGKATYRIMLDDDRAWAENKTASAERVIELLKLGNNVSVWTIKRWIVAPVLKEREQNKQRC